MSTPEASSFSLQCPLPLKDYPAITMSHGGGGSLMQTLIESMFVKAFDNPLLRQRHDGAVFPSDGRPMALTTDSYVVRPLFFPGGTIGTLAVNGTVNDLAMCGARPLYLTAGFILEEGFPMADLWRIVLSMRTAAQEAGVQIVTGDTKVVDKGKGDGVFINTAGVGVVESPAPIAPRQVKADDVILLSGDIGRHGIAILAAREGLSFETAIQSDCAPLADMALDLLANRVDIHCMRDLTRGGLAAALTEIAETSGLGMDIDEAAIPVLEDVRGACEMLGIDPLLTANEGRMIALVAPQDAERALSLMRHHPVGQGAVMAGRVTASNARRVTLKTVIGSHRIVDLPGGEQLPRIC